MTFGLPEPSTLPCGNLRRMANVERVFSEGKPTKLLWHVSLLMTKVPLTLEVPTHWSTSGTVISLKKHSESTRAVLLVPLPGLMESSIPVVEMEESISLTLLMAMQFSKYSNQVSYQELLMSSKKN